MIRVDFERVLEYATMSFRNLRKIKNEHLIKAKPFGTLQKDL